MVDDRKGAVHAASDGGVAGDHASPEPFEFLVGPTTTDQFNTARLRLIPIACWRVDDIRFAFDSSFITLDPASDSTGSRNDIRTELAALSNLVKAHPGSPLSVFGHADPVGSDDYNKALSGRRAMALYALLIINTDAERAVHLWKQISGTESWNSNQRQMMKSLTGLPDGTPDAVLFKAYMKALCPPDLKLDAHADFLAHGADAGGKGDFQGCGEFNPLLIFSEEKQTEFDRAKQKNDEAVLEDRNAQNALNRRVMVLMFRKNSRVDPAKWPCPRAAEGVAGCVKRFFSDGEKRRSTRLPDQPRVFEKTKDTFACRFYHRLTDASPCEKRVRTVRIRLFDRQSDPLPKAPFLALVAGRQISGFTLPGGEAVLRDVQIPATCLIRWSRPSRDLDSLPKPPEPGWRDFEFEHTVFLDLELADAAADSAVASPPAKPDFRRLHNMGYIFKDTPEQNVRAFQKDAGLGISGNIDDASRTIRRQHDVIEAPPKAV